MNKIHVYNTFFIDKTITLISIWLKAIKYIFLNVCFTFYQIHCILSLCQTKFFVDFNQPRQILMQVSVEQFPTDEPEISSISWLFGTTKPPDNVPFCEINAPRSTLRGGLKLLDPAKPLKPVK